MTMETAYAQVLWRLIQSGKSPKDAIIALRGVLVNDGRESLLPRIGKAFERIAKREMAKARITLHVAREADEHKAKKEAKSAMEKLGLADKKVDVVIDDHLIGGWRLEGGEYLVDESYKKHLLSIYNRATNE